MDSIIANFSPFKPLEVKNILVIKLDHIGDQVLALPALRLLRRRFKDTRIVGLMGPWAITIAELSDVFDELITYNFYQEKRSSHPLHDSGKEQRLSERLKEYKFDLAIDLRRQPDTRKFLKLSGAKLLAGYKTGGELDGELDISLESYADSPGERTILNRTNNSIQILNLVEEVVKRFVPASDLFLKISEVESQSSREKLKKLGVDFSKRPLIGIHIGATHPAKQWGVDKFSGLINSLVNDMQAQVVIFGSQEDIPMGESILQVLHSEDTILVAGKLSLKEFIAGLNNFDMIIGNDNGGLHCAAAVGVPSITIFSGRELPAEWSSFYPYSYAVYQDIFCSPCHLDDPSDCKYKFECIKNINLETVLHAVRILLEKKRINFNYLQVKNVEDIPEIIAKLSCNKIVKPESHKRIVIAYSVIVENDAIGTDCVEQCKILRNQGYEAYIFANRTDPVFAQMLLNDEKILQDENSVLIYHHGNFWEEGYNLLKNFKGKIVLRYHNITPPEFFMDYSKKISKHNKMGRKQTEDLLKNYKIEMVLCDSHFNSEDILSCGVSSAKVRVVPPFHNINKFDNIPANNEILRRYLDGQHHNVLFVGRISPHKGLKEVINVAGVYKELFGDNVRFILVGGCDPELYGYFEELKRLSRRLNVDDNVIFTNRVNNRDLKTYYLCSNSFIMMSHHEGFCVPLIEAQYFKVPVVSYKAGAISETLGNNQLIYDSIDYERFASAIFTILNDDDYRYFLTRNGMRNFERFSYNKLKESFLNCIKEVI